MRVAGSCNWYVGLMLSQAFRYQYKQLTYQEIHIRIGNVWRESRIK